MTVQHELQCTHGDSVSNWIFYTQAIFRRLEHRKPSAKMRLCLKDNKPCLVSSGHFLRTARLVRTRHLVHVSNGRYDPHSPGHPVFICCCSETSFEEAGLKPLSELLLLICSHGDHRTPEERSTLFRAACAVPPEQPGVLLGGDWQVAVHCGPPSQSQRKLSSSP